MWLCETGEEFDHETDNIVKNGELFGRSRSHVSHIAFWSDVWGRQHNEDKYLDNYVGSIRDNNFADPMHSWGVGSVESSTGIGFFGIWETTSNDQHFELNKGGVFRAIPLFD